MDCSQILLHLTDQHLLRTALACAGHPDIKLTIAGKTLRISTKLALLMARSGEYEWSGTVRRVRWMSPIQRHPWQACYRTTRSATLQPSIDWLHQLHKKIRS